MLLGEIWKLNVPIFFCICYYKAVCLKKGESVKKNQSKRIKKDELKNKFE